MPRSRAIRCCCPRANAIPILYGGSVTSANIGEFLAEPSIDGALVGGASLDLASFEAICHAGADTL